MFAQFALTLAMIAPSAPIPKDVSPKGPPPLVAELKANEDGKVLVMIRREVKSKVAVTGRVNPANPNDIETREVTSLRMMQVDLSEVKDLVVTTAAGKAVDTKDALSKIKEGAVVVLTTNGQKVDPNFLRVFKDDTLVLVSPEFVGTPRLGSGPSTGIIRPVPGIGGAKLLPINPAPAVIPPAPVEEKK